VTHRTAVSTADQMDFAEVVQLVANG
jgi:hypothetical protein